MKKALALAAVLLASLTLTGCGQTKEEEYEDCLKSYQDSGFEQRNSDSMFTPEGICYLSVYSD